MALPSTLTGCSGGESTDGNPNGEGGSAAAGKASSAGTSAQSGSSTGGKSTAGSSNGSSGATGTGVPGSPGEIGGCQVFPGTDAWNVDISQLEADPAWTQKVTALTGDVNLHPDYGADGAELYGIPINVVPESQPLVDVSFDDYADESDPGPYPFPGPDQVKIEGNNPEACEGDCHLLAVQQGTCMLYEGYACEHRVDGWHCANGAKWDLKQASYGQRPVGWTSADAAGLAITPGILRYDEVRSGEVRHALRFTLDCTTNRYVNPATHQAVPGGCDPADAPPMGTRVRLKADFDVAGFGESAQVVLAGMKKYGMILADNGSNFYFQGEANPGWTEADIEPLKGVPASAFEVLKMPPLEP